MVQTATCPVVTVGPQVKGGHLGCGHVLYSGDTALDAASLEAWFAQQCGATFEQIPAAGREQVLRQIQNRAVDLLVLGGQKAADLSGAYGLILNARCPVMTLLSDCDLMSYGENKESKNIVNKFGPEFLISLFPEAKGLLKLVS